MDIISYMCAVSISLTPLSSRACRQVNIASVPLKRSVPKLILRPVDVMVINNKPSLVIGGIFVQTKSDT
jgi:hypothetical protein